MTCSREIWEPEKGWDAAPWHYDVIAKPLGTVPEQTSQVLFLKTMTQDVSLLDVPSFHLSLQYAGKLDRLKVLFTLILSKQNKGLKWIVQRKW